MSYVEKHLISGETIQYQTKLHWIVMLGHVAIAAVFELLAIAILIASFSRPKGAKSMPSHGADHVGALICLLVGAVLFCVGLLKRNVTEMAVTNKRVIVKTGLAERRTTEILLSRIESVVVDEPAIGRILGYGTVRNGDRARHRRHPRSIRENLSSLGIQRTSPAPDCGRDEIFLIDLVLR